MKKLLSTVLCALLIGSVNTSLNAYSGWKQDNGKWWYLNADGGYTKNGWQVINDEFYYFDQDGYMLSNTTTPDGYYVNDSGQWTENGVIKTDSRLKNFKMGYQKGDINVLNDADLSSKYDGNPYWIEGNITKIQDDHESAYSGILNDVNEKNWYIMIDNPRLTSKEAYTQFIDHNICIDGLYFGYASKYDMPCIIATKIYNLDTGSTINCSLVNYVSKYKDLIPARSVSADLNSNSNDKKVNVQNAGKYVVGENKDTDFDEKSNSSAKSGYERIYNTYKKKIQNSDGDINELAEICTKGQEKMAEYYLKSGGKYSTYQTWWNKLYDVYQEKVINIF